MVRDTLAVRIVVLLVSIAASTVAVGLVARELFGTSTVVLPTALAMCVFLLPIALASLYWGNRLRLRPRSLRPADWWAAMLAATVIAFSALPYMLGLGWAQARLVLPALVALVVFATLQLTAILVVWRSNIARERHLPLLEYPEPSPLSGAHAKRARILMWLGTALTWAAAYALARGSLLLGLILASVGSICVIAFLILYRRIIVQRDRAA